MDLADPMRLEARLQKYVEAGLIDAGMAQRIRLLTRLAPTTVGTGSGTAARTAAEAPALSGQALGELLGLSRASVHKHVDHLRSLGFAVESVGGVGYRLAAPFADLVAGEALVPYLLQALDAAERAGERLEPGWMAGLPCFYRASSDSTNQVLRRLIKGETPPTGALVVTDHQSQGRGRLDRIWRDLGGKDLMFSVLLRPSLAPGQAHLLSLAAALAVAETLESLQALGLPALRGPVDVKWPNDVMLRGRKVCGILLEGAMDGDRLHWAIAGIGVNVNSDTAALTAAIEREDPGGLSGRVRPASLSEMLGRPLPRAPLLAALLLRLTRRWKDLEDPEGVTAILAGLRRRDPLAGRPVEVFGSVHRGEVISGEGAGIGAEGQLLLRTDSGEIVPVYAGDVSLRPSRSPRPPHPVNPSAKDG